MSLRSPPDDRSRPAWQPSGLHDPPRQAICSENNTRVSQRVGCRVCWPCSACGAPGVRDLGSRGYCAAHLAKLYRRISAETWAWRGAGVGLPIGPIATDGEADLSCSMCSASWTGAAFADCSWCLEAAECQRAWQAGIVLTPPDVDPTDRRYDGTMRGWGDRLAVAVAAGIVEARLAERAWCREVGCDAA